MSRVIQHVKVILVSFIFTSTMCFGQWNQVGSTIHGTSSGDLLGSKIRFNEDGSVMAIAAWSAHGSAPNSGQVTVYKFINSDWVQMGQHLDGEYSSDWFGMSLSLNDDGNTVAAGTWSNSDGGIGAGHVRAFHFNGGSWIQMGADIDGSSSENMGRSIALSGDGLSLAIGSPGNVGFPGSDGEVKVYTYDGSAWSQLGNAIASEAGDDHCGYSVAISNDGLTVVVGSPENDGAGNNAGHVRVFEYSGGTWSQLDQDIDGAAAEDQFGEYVSISADGSKIAAASKLNDGNGVDAGHVRVFENIGGTWSQLGSDIVGDIAGDEFGHTICLSDDGLKLTAGSKLNSGNGTYAGHVRVFKFLSSDWFQSAPDFDGEATGDRAGIVGMSGNGARIAIGGPTNFAFGSAGYVRTFDDSTFSDAGIDVHSTQCCIKIGPNPTNGKLKMFFESNKEVLQFKLTNINGVVIETKTFYNQQEINYQIRQASGVYFIEVEANEASYGVHRIIID